jgi:hypothetical protein
MLQDSHPPLSSSHRRLQSIFLLQYTQEPMSCRICRTGHLRISGQYFELTRPRSIAARAMPVPIAIAPTPRLDRPLLPSQQFAQYTGQHGRQSFGSYRSDPLNQMTSHSWANVTQASGQSPWGPLSRQRPVYSTLLGSQGSMATTNSIHASATSSFTPAVNPSFNLENWSDNNVSFRTT